MFFFVNICISLCLRAPRKIDSSIGLPSLNKVVTYLLTYFHWYTGQSDLGVAHVMNMLFHWFTVQPNLSIALVANMSFRGFTV